MLSIKALSNVVAEIIDGQLYDSQYIFKKLRKEKFDIIRMSPCFNSYDRVLKIAHFAKKCGSKVVLGGHYATALKEEILKNRGWKSNDYCIDAVIQYDGEKVFYEYVGLVGCCP